MNDLLQDITDKYQGTYVKGPEKVGYTPEGVLKVQLSHTTFVSGDYTVRLVCDEKGSHWNPYKVLVFLKRQPKQKVLINPRSFWGTSFRRADHRALNRKYKISPFHGLYAQLVQDFKLESLLLEFTVSIYTLPDEQSPAVILSSHESVLDVGTLDAHIEICMRIATILDNADSAYL